ncbi:type VI secretion system-associated FHA domain protein TagH [Massilia arenae]|uniref:Type VI secretion system-associated FHA domain protein TagH n=1 Tax=Massilia arenae TaxID=2603288 RepID=A0A5C7G3C9_9BURK|nr:type VI secretion system-associated FHA domain protein TagH [Massilia arenae]TXF99241.1 type VI secretion system-associated FHA domain protein TagH [Massilia arenae]
MKLRLHVLSYRDQPPPEPLQAEFDAEGGMVGRAPGNRLVLEDPDKYVSRSHASVTLRDGRYYLTDAGSNPSIVNDRPLGAGSEVALDDGDRIVVGDYVLQAVLEGPVTEDATMMAPAPKAASAPAFIPVSAPAWPPAPFEPGPPDSLAGARILDGAAAAGGDDPLGLGLSGIAAKAAHGARPAADHDHVPPERQAFAPPPVFAAIPADYDPLADLQRAAPPPPPQPLPPPPVPPPAAIEPPPAAAPAAESAVLHALLDGLGLPQLRTSHAPEDLARLAGELLRGLTAGTMDVLVARALTKRESHIDMTMIAPRANNPLKFFPDAGSALGQMLGAGMPGYLAPQAAVQGAFDDLKAHELAVIAGMRAALGAVVQRFDPARIEGRLSEPGRFDRLLPASRKARMWDRLVELYGELARDADEDLQRLFGEKFSSAYAQQVERLRAGQPSSTPDSSETP